MIQQRLNDLYIAAVVHETLDNLDISQLIGDFTDMKGRKAHLV